MLERQTRSFGDTSAMSKVAFRAGSSQQGKQRRASVASNCVAAAYRSSPVRLGVERQVRGADRRGEVRGAQEGQVRRAHRRGRSKGQEEEENQRDRRNGKVRGTDGESKCSDFP